MAEATEPIKDKNSGTKPKAHSYSLRSEARAENHDRERGFPSPSHSHTNYDLHYRQGARGNAPNLNNLESDDTSNNDSDSTGTVRPTKTNSKDRSQKSLLHTSKDLELSPGLKDYISQFITTTSKEREKSTLRRMCSAVGSVITDQLDERLSSQGFAHLTNQLPQNKQIGAAANQPVNANLQPQINLNNGMQSTSRELPTLGNRINSIEGLINRLENRLNLLDQHENNNNSRNNNNHNQSQNLHYNRLRFDFDKWKAKFDGQNMSVGDFLFRLSQHQESFDVPWDYIYRNFQFFLTGPALDWYYRHKRQHRTDSWFTFKQAFLDQFRSLENEFQISTKIANRKQKIGESFVSYYEDISKLNSRLDIPKSDRELIEIIRENLQPRIKEILFTHTTHSLNDLVYKCRQAEQLLKENSVNRNRVSEINSLNENLTPEVRIEAFTANRNLNLSNRDYSNFICWNCNARGHGFMDCEQPRNYFCYKCGHKNVKSVKACPKCTPNNSQNFRVSEIGSGESQLTPPSPE